MAKKRTPTGVVPRDKSIRIWFMWQGTRHWETLSIPPTPANIKYVTKMREDICTRISIGVFDYADFFLIPKLRNSNKQNGLCRHLQKSQINGSRPQHTSRHQHGMGIEKC